jgi:hypothetical protein
LLPRRAAPRRAVALPLLRRAAPREQHPASTASTATAS